MQKRIRIRMEHLIGGIRDGLVKPGASLFSWALREDLGWVCCSEPQLCLLWQCEVMLLVFPATAVFLTHWPGVPVARYWGSCPILWRGHISDEIEHVQGGMVVDKDIYLHSDLSF